MANSGYPYDGNSFKNSVYGGVQFENPWSLQVVMVLLSHMSSDQRDVVTVCGCRRCTNKGICWHEGTCDEGYPKEPLPLYHAKRVISGEALGEFLLCPYFSTNIAGVHTNIGAGLPEMPKEEKS